MSEANLSTLAPPHAVPSRPLGELMPKGARAVIVASVAAALVVADFVRFGATGWAYIGVVLLPVLVLLASIDLQHRLLPNRIVLPTALVVVVVVAATQPDNLVMHLAAGIALGALFFAVGSFFPGSLGMGDAKLGLLLGFALGSKTFAAVEIALLAVLIAAVWIIATQGMAARKKTIPFGPFLALGGILGFFLG